MLLIVAPLKMSIIGLLLAQHRPQLKVAQISRRSSASRLQEDLYSATRELRAPLNPLPSPSPPPPHDI
jgi:hypothetical protein